MTADTKWRAFVGWWDDNSPKFEEAGLTWEQARDRIRDQLRPFLDDDCPYCRGQARLHHRGSRRVTAVVLGTLAGVLLGYHLGRDRLTRRERRLARAVFVDHVPGPMSTTLPTPLVLPELQAPDWLEVP